MIIFLYGSIYRAYNVSYLTYKAFNKKLLNKSIITVHVIIGEYIYNISVISIRTLHGYPLGATYKYKVVERTIFNEVGVTRESKQVG